ncbi:MAG: DUF559 domain-containing protein [Clostridia bacterium]|nr:DUF559 domain-containing protein [Clostridia bacterium]
MYDYEFELLKYSQELRKNMTPEEKKLWYQLLCRLPVPVKRQKIIGKYIVDFYIPYYKVVLEIDGIQHSAPDSRVSDIERDEYLAGLGIRVLRYKNSDVNTRYHDVADNILGELGLTVKDLRAKR